MYDQEVTAITPDMDYYFSTELVMATRIGFAVVKNTV